MQARNTDKEHFNAVHSPARNLGNNNCNTGCSVPQANRFGGKQHETASQRGVWNSEGCWRRGHFIWTWRSYCADHCQDYRADTVRCWKKTQLNRRAAKAEISESQNATRRLGCYCPSLTQSCRGWKTGVDRLIICVFLGNYNMHPIVLSVITDKLNNRHIILLRR